MSGKDTNLRPPPYGPAPQGAHGARRADGAPRPRLRAQARVSLAALVALALASGCAGAGDGEPGGGSGSPKSQRLTVWLMQGSAPDALVARLNKKFERTHPGVKVTYRAQQWGGIQERLRKAFAGGEAPDVIETGNTQTAGFAARDELHDLTRHTKELGGQEWLPELAEQGRWKKRQYGVPFFASSRVVVYRKDMFREAGIEAPPRTREEWLKATRALNAAHKNEKDFQGIYLPGQYWYVLAGFVWDEGGDLAQRDGEGGWRGSLGGERARRGMDFYKKLHALSRTDTGIDEGKPLQYEEFAKGNMAQMVGLPWYAINSVKANPKLKGKLGAFPVPGKTRARSGTVFLGGSHLAVPEASGHKTLARAWIREMTSRDQQVRLAHQNNAVPARADAGRTAAEDASPVLAAVIKGSREGGVPPIHPRWSGVEEGANPVKRYMTEVLEGTDPRKAAKKADTEITRRMNGKAG